MIDAIQKMVAKETEANVQAAEQEWQKRSNGTTGHNRFQPRRRSVCVLPVQESKCTSATSRGRASAMR